MAENLRRSPQTKQELLLADIYSAIINGGGGVPLATEATLLLVDSNIVLGNLTLNEIDTVLDTIKIDSDTLATPIIGLPMTLNSYTNTTGTIPAGKRSISILNTGGVSASIGGVSNNLPAGVEVTWEASGLRDTLGSLDWNITLNGGTTLTISTVG